MDRFDLPDDQQRAISALVAARREYPEADFFEHDRISVRMPGARHDVSLPIEREVLRKLGHAELIQFRNTERTPLGHGRWTFDLLPLSAEFA